ncbi:MAG TPA: hypothetical protein VGD63_17420 [Steroidobacteraceae bacterium]
MRVAVDIQRLPVNVARAAQREMQHAACDGRIADLVDQNEAAELAALPVSLEHQRLVRREVCNTDGIEAQGFGSQMLHCIHIDLIFRTVDRRRSPLRREF